ncbi:cobalamin trafficking protein CblD-like [Mercenaria mercenaria]|uniref:cobalamin trafficking protein CblD-like n=1 Tax=Mercenaria mercenaria TaxID=6596 RepID=UPI00234E7651|nr:cobalamin trafficking protein CblD-like [Mercenaria mercenaria]XP_053374607.1 cobalamin trafficking protein CblD-like [Mercenaria mercenaria]XP_053374608.1 cobalamin trafficking protein CblD-like [Mercenaria mercenaria]
MASRLLSKRVMYLPNLRAVVNHFRAFSWYNNGENADSYKVVGETESESFTVWPDEKLGPFGPQDKRYPLPGRVGTTLKTPTVAKNAPTIQTLDLDTLFAQLPSERHKDILTQAQEEAESLEAMEESENLEKPVPSAEDLLECVAHECPQLMRKDFADLFPWMDIMQGHFTVITVSQKTKEDMSGWSMEVEAEREELLDSFIKGATEICEALNKVGYWADFIDPSCGKPFHSQHTNSSLFETDERYRKLGFEIEDLGCCKVIRHHIWGTHAYIGCLFTNAPTTDPILKMMKKS